MKRIFMIDDDPEDREIFKYTLGMMNFDFEFVTASDGVDALEMIADKSFAKPDIIFVDLYMLHMGGYEFVLKMREIPGYEKIPTYIYTSCTSVHEHVNCMTAGANGCVIKHAWSSDLAKELAPLLLDYRATG